MMCSPVSWLRNSAAHERRRIVSSRRRRSSASEVSSCWIVLRRADVRSSTVCSKPLAMAAVLDLERPPPERVADVDEQLVRLERLEDVAVRAVLGGDLGVARVVQAA